MLFLQLLALALCCPVLPTAATLLLAEDFSCASIGCNATSHGITNYTYWRHSTTGSKRSSLTIGPAGSGRSSMLFQYALQVAMGGGRVLYISGKEQSQQSRPLLPARLDEDEEVEEAFGRIGLKYITAAQDLQMYSASMAAPPDLLVVDSWTDILPPCVTPAEPRAHDRRALTAHTLSLLRRATTAADSALKTMALLHNATAPRDPPGGASSSGSPRAEPGDESELGAAALDEVPAESRYARQQAWP